MRRRRALLALLATMLLLTGCWDQRELEEQNYMVAIGIDKGKKERLGITFVLSRPSQTASGDDKDTGGMITVESPTLTGAISYLNTVISRPTSLEQTKLIMLSEELVKDEGMVILEEAARSRNLRRSTMLVVTKQSVKKILDSLPPGPEGLNDFAFIQTSAESRRSGFLPVRTTLNDFLIRASTAYQEPVAYYAAIAETDEKDGGGDEQEGEQKEGDEAKEGDAKEEEGDKKEDEEKEGEEKEGEEKEGDQKAEGKGEEEQPTRKRMIPGVSRRKGGPKVDFFGAAAFRQTKMVGTLDAQDTRAMLMIQDKFTESNLELFDPSDKENVVAVRISTGRPTRVRANLVNGRPQFKVEITLEGHVIAMPSMTDYTQPDQRPKLEEQLSQTIKEQVETFFKKTQEWEADVGGLGRRIVRKFPTVDAWHAFKWPDQYKDAEIEVSVQTELRRFGVQLSPQTQESRDKTE